MFFINYYKSGEYRFNLLQVPTSIMKIALGFEESSTVTVPIAEVVKYLYPFIHNKKYEIFWGYYVIEWGHRDIWDGVYYL